jgi:ferredoxin
VVGGKTDESKSSGTFEDDEIEMAREAEEPCPVSVITDQIVEYCASE